MFCYFMLCYVMLCYAILCYLQLCYVKRHVQADLVELDKQALQLLYETQIYHLRMLASSMYNYFRKSGAEKNQAYFPGFVCEANGRKCEN